MCRQFLLMGFFQCFQCLVVLFELVDLAFKFYHFCFKGLTNFKDFCFHVLAFGEVVGFYA